MLQASRAHLANVGESYFEHMRFALVVGALVAGAGLACMLHALVPACCERTCSRTIGLMQRLFADRTLLPSVIAESSGLLIFAVLMFVSLACALTTAFCIASWTIVAMLVPQAFVLPLIYLAQNRGLDPVAAWSSPLAPQATRCR